jgi:hypothetical protein
MLIDEDHVSSINPKTLEVSRFFEGIFVKISEGFFGDGNAQEKWLY